MKYHYARLGYPGVLIYWIIGSSMDDVSPEEI
jgi:hypothetical protein